VVFLYRCASNARRETNSGVLCFSEKWGTCINFPQADGLTEGKAGNIFFDLQREEEAKKERAELRRLLYVAMTRAESALYLSASLPPQTKNEKETDGDLDGEAYDEDLIRARLSGLAFKRTDKADTFLDLLLPVLVSDAAAQSALFTVNVIPVKTRTELFAEAGSRGRAGSPGRTGLLRSMALAAERAAPLYESRTKDEPAPYLPGQIPASGLSLPFVPALEEDRTERDGAETEIDRLLKGAKIDAAEFGTIAHAFLEAHFTGKPPLIPPAIAFKLSDKELDKLSSVSGSITERFLDSKLGRLTRGASFWETEFPFLTRVRTKFKAVVIRGKIDLLFESGGTVHVVDFKTDREINPEHHYGQLAVYERAVSDIYGKPVQTWLFYLRYAEDRELSGEVKNVNVEALAEAYLERLAVCEQAVMRSAGFS
jgi:ATP-dependent helicase/nuclease subunit A